MRATRGAGTLRKDLPKHEKAPDKQSRVVNAKLIEGNDVFRVALQGDAGRLVFSGEFTPLNIFAIFPGSVGGSRFRIQPCPLKGSPARVLSVVSSSFRQLGASQPSRSDDIEPRGTLFSIFLPTVRNENFAPRGTPATCGRRPCGPEGRCFLREAKSHRASLLGRRIERENAGFPETRLGGTPGRYSPEFLERRRAAEGTKAEPRAGNDCQDVHGLLSDGRSAGHGGKMLTHRPALTPGDETSSEGGSRIRVISRGDVGHPWLGAKSSSRRAESASLGRTFVRRQRREDGEREKVIGEEEEGGEELRESQEERGVVGEEEEESRSGYKYAAPPAPNVHLRRDQTEPNRGASLPDRHETAHGTSPLVPRRLNLVFGETNA
ncbi:hypothetical protein KM043_005947 [Ampulex compressa]|nr:hypothetical protein KM043_005947 [Ampulex compressa]